ncbi:MAG: hypothetical protein JRN15_21790, partial [Nitrososphaerota archaeon]|nr:hypothetical protein [Nitrososphaerota archaeon]
MMSNTELKIIDTISGSIGNSISISGLTTEIKDRYGSAYYPNIYKAILSLKKENIIQLQKQGKASILSRFSRLCLKQSSWMLLECSEVPP